MSRMDGVRLMTPEVRKTKKSSSMWGNEKYQKIHVSLLVRLEICHWGSWTECVTYGNILIFRFGKVLDF